MKEIKKIEEIINSKENVCLKEVGVNRTLFWAYLTTKEAGNNLIDFNEVIWNHDIEEIAKTLRENEINEFTISSTFSSLIETLAEFEKQGINMVGLTTVNARHTDWLTGEHTKIPAIKMIVKEA